MDTIILRMLTKEYDLIDLFAVTYTIQSTTASVRWSKNLKVGPDVHLALADNNSLLT